MSFDLAWTDSFKWWRKPLGYLKLLRARRKYGIRLGLTNPFAKGRLLRRKVGYQALLHRLRNVHQGKRCFVIGNGAGLKKLDLSPLKNEITIGSNELYSLFPEMGFHTSYLVVEGPAFCEERSLELKHVKGPIKIIGLSNAYCMPVDDRTLFMDITRDGETEKMFSEDPAASIFFGQSNIYLSLQIAFHLGCNPVYLVGVDFNFDSMERKFGSGVIDVTPDVIEHLRSVHFNPEYFRRGHHIRVPNKERLHTAYRTAAEFYNNHGRRIINTGVGSNLCVFEKIDFSSLFSKHGQRKDEIPSFGIGGSHMDEVAKMIQPKVRIDRSQIFYEKALKLCKSGQPHRALEYLNKSVENRPNALAFYLMASITKSLGRYDESARVFHEMLDDETLYVDRRIIGGAHFHLGEIVFKAGDYPRAKEHLLRCLEAIPSHRKAGEYLRVIRAEGSAKLTVAEVEELVP